MITNYLIIASIISIICRCIIFKNHDIKMRYAIIPGAYMYQFGKIINNKKLGIINLISDVFYKIYFILCFGLEVWIVKNYVVNVQLPAETSVNAGPVLQIAVPDHIANLAIWSKYLLIAFSVVNTIFWCIMMWKFTMQNKKSSWWIMLWAIMPVVPYIYFAASKEVVIDGKRYKLERAEIVDDTSTTNNREKRRSKH